ncbi:MAG: hypothetical protein KAT35_02830, partial [Candidatus Aenigmarchaeota archaeon]|nr:hypothetical protein [Candidatus Aenigmarchaeota archaeon]
RATVIKPEQVVQLCYGTRLFEKVVLELSRVQFQAIPTTNDAEQLLSHLVKKAGVSKWVSGRTFRVSCIKSFAQHDVDDSHDVVPSLEMVGLTGAAILAACPKTKVKLENPEVIVQLIYLKKALVLSLDLCGFELSKREYRIFNHSRAVRGTVAAAAFSLTQWKKGKILVDPLGKAGVLLIEAALAASKRPVHYFQKDKFLITRLGRPFTKQVVQRVMKAVDKKARKIDPTLYYQDQSQRFVAAAKKNAKIAGVDKFIKFSRTEVSWLDLRFEENTVAVILTQVPTPGKNNARKEIEEMLAELFYQAAYVLEKKGAVVLICSDSAISKKGAEKHCFTLERELNIYQGMLPLVLQRWIPRKSSRRPRNLLIFD